MSEDKETPEQKEERIDRARNIQYRISPEELKVISRITEMLHQNGSLKTNTVSAFMKAAAFTQINIYLQLEARENAYKERQVELDRRNVRNIRGFDYVPNLGQY